MIAIDAPPIGVHTNTSRHVYDAWQAVNYSMLKGILPPTTPAKFQWNQLQPKEPTKFMSEGDWIDALLYDRDRLETDFMRIPEDMPDRPTDRMINAKKPSEGSLERIAAWAAFDAEKGTKQAIPAALYDEAETIVEKFYEHPVASAIRDAPHKQLAIVWQDEKTGLYCKGLIDTVAQYQGWTTLIDVKTVGDSADERNFGRRGDNMHYPMQAFMYHRGLEILIPAQRRWLWVVMERKPPFQIATYYADEATFALGEHEFRLAIDTYANCLETGVWPSYPIEPQPFHIPAYKRKVLGL